MSIDTPHQIVNNYPNQLFAAKAENMSRLLSDLRAIDWIDSTFSFGAYHHVTFVTDEANNINRTKIHLERLGHTAVSIQEIEPTIEDCFMHLMEDHDS